MKKLMGQITRVDAELQRLEAEATDVETRRAEIRQALGEADAARALGETATVDVAALERELAALAENRPAQAVAALRQRRRLLVEALPGKLEAELAKRKNIIEADSARRWAAAQKKLDEAAAIVFADPPLVPAQPHLIFLQTPENRAQHGPGELRISGGRFVFDHLSGLPNPVRDQLAELERIGHTALLGDHERAARQLLGLPSAGE